MKRRWPLAQYAESPQETASLSKYIFAPDAWCADRPIRLVLLGTEFDTRVWTILLRIPVGRAVSYIDIASHISRPTASRAVGSAVGRNPISFVVPCQRVLRTDGALGGYHWASPESAQCSAGRRHAARGRSIVPVSMRRGAAAPHETAGCPRGLLKVLRASSTGMLFRANR